MADVNRPYRAIELLAYNGWNIINREDDDMGLKYDNIRGMRRRQLEVILIALGYDEYFLYNMAIATVENYGTNNITKDSIFKDNVFKDTVNKNIKDMTDEIAEDIGMPKCEMAMEYTTYNIINMIIKDKFIKQIYKVADMY